MLRGIVPTCRFLMLAIALCIANPSVIDSAVAQETLTEEEQFRLELGLDPAAGLTRPFTEQEKEKVRGFGLDPDVLDASSRSNAPPGITPDEIDQLKSTPGAVSTTTTNTTIGDTTTIEVDDDRTVTTTPTTTVDETVTTIEGPGSKTVITETTTTTVIEGTVTEEVEVPSTSPPPIVTAPPATPPQEQPPAPPVGLPEEGAPPPELADPPEPSEVVIPPKPPEQPTPPVPPQEAPPPKAPPAPPPEAPTLPAVPTEEETPPSSPPGEENPPVSPPEEDIPQEDHPPSEPPTDEEPPQEDTPAADPPEDQTPPTEPPAEDPPQEDDPPADTPEVETPPSDQPEGESPPSDSPEDADTPETATPETDTPEPPAEEDPPSPPQAPAIEDKPRPTDAEIRRRQEEAEDVRRGVEGDAIRALDRQPLPYDYYGPTRERRKIDSEAVSDQIRRLGGTVVREPKPPVEVPEEEIEIPPLAPPEVPPSVPPPEIPGDPPCCGLLSGVVYFPKGHDWLKPAEHQPARHDVGMIAHQVLAHNGSFLHDQAALHVGSVGFPMQISYHYRSGLEETERGGIIGHKWDLNINKRIVAKGAGVTKENLSFERQGIDTPELTYYDGHGRGDIYKGASTQLRKVRNFDAEFRAIVTTYKSPAGAFHEIQRYILVGEAKHPFREHVNVDPTQQIFYVLRHKNGLLYIFNCHGQMIYVIDRHKNRMELRYQGDLNPLTHNPMLSEVYDTAGRKYVFETLFLPNDKAGIGTNILCKPVNGIIPIPRFKRIVEEATGRSITFNYARSNTRPILDYVTLSFGRSLQHRYTYTGGEDYLLASITAPREASARTPYLTNDWNTDKKRVKGQTWGSGTYRITYSGNEPIYDGADVVDPNGNTFAYKIAEKAGGAVISEIRLTDSEPRNGGPWTHRFEHNGDTQITKVTYPRGNSISFSYEGGNKPVTLGPIRNWLDRNYTYANNLQQGNLLGVTRTSSEDDDPYKTIDTSRSYEDLYNQIDQSTDARGNTTTYTYVYSQGPGFYGNAKEMLLPDLTRPTTSKLTGLKYTFAYSPKGQLVSETAPDGQTKTYTYNPSGYMTGVTGPEGTVSFGVDSRGNVTRKTWPGGRIDTYEYDLRDLQTGTVVDSEGFKNEAISLYDLNGNLTRRTTYIKDNFDDRVSSGRKPRSVAQTSLIENYTYDITNRQLTHTTTGPGYRRTITREFDGVGNATKETAPSMAGSGTTETTMTYDARGLMTQSVETASAGLTITKAYRHDENGNLEIYMGPESLEEQYSYDGFDRQVSKVMHTGADARYTLDKAGNITRMLIHGPDGGETFQNVDLMKSEFSYDEAGNLVSRKRFPLNVSGSVDEHWIYNRSFNLEQHKGPGKGSTRYTYDTAGRVMSVVDTTGTTITNEYDAAGNRSKLTETWTQRSYRAGASAWRENQRSREWTYLHDALARLISQAGPDGTTKHFYDSASNQRGVLNENNVLVSQTFDGAGRMLASSSGRKTETYQYTHGGLMTSAISPVRNETWTYDAFGGLLSHADNMAGRTTRYRLNAAGQVLSTFDPNGTEIRRELDPAGQVTKAFIIPGRVLIQLGQDRYPGFRSGSVEEYRYDGLGRTVYATADITRVERTYDGLGNIIEEKQTLSDDTQTVTSRYSTDLSSRTVTYPTIAGSTAVTTEYDDAGRIIGVQAGSSRVARFNYSGKGFLNARHFGNGFTTTYGYDDKLRLSNISVMEGAGPSTYRTVWTGSATYDGLYATGITETTRGVNAADRVSITRTTLDTKKRPTATITTQASVAFADKPATSMTSGVLREYDRLGRPSTVVEYLQDDLAAQGRNAGKLLHVQSDALTYNNANRVQSTLAKANIDIEGGNLRDIDRGKELAESGNFTRTQRFYYDNNGNLLMDDRYIYAYNHNNQVTIIRDRWQPYRFEQFAIIYYDAFGRRVAIRNSQPGVSGGFVQWGPTYVPNTRLIYDGLIPVVELIKGHPDSTREALLAKYYYGASGSDVIRMDRKRNDAPSNDLNTYYLHESFGGSIRLLSDDNSSPVDPIFRDPPGRDRPGASGSPPGDRHVARGTNTRIPNIGTHLRIDGFAGTQYDFNTGRTIFDFHRNPVLDRNISTAKFRESITRFQNKGAVILVGMTALPFSPYLLSSGWSLFFGSVGLAMDWGTAAWTQSGYSFGQGLSTFLMSATGARIGIAVNQAGLGLWTGFAADFAADVSFGVLIDYGWHGKRLSRALADNMKQAAIFGTVGFAAGLTIPRVVVKASSMLADYRTPRLVPDADLALGGNVQRRGGGRSPEEAQSTHCPLCFAPGTRVLAKSGWKKIEDVSVGDEVWSRDETTGDTGFKPVTETFVTAPDGFVHLYYRLKESGRHGDDDDEHELIGTPTHPFWSVDKNAWVDLSDLNPGDALMTADGKVAEVIRTETKNAPDGAPFTAHNFTVKDWSSYFAAPEAGTAVGIWVHNVSENLACRVGASPRPAMENVHAGDLPMLREMAEFIREEVPQARWNDEMSPWADDNAFLAFLMDNFNDGNPIWLYRGINPPGGKLKRGTWKTDAWTRAQNGTVVAPGRRTDAWTLEQHVNDVYPLDSGATSWTTDVSKAIRSFAGSNKSVLLAVELSTVWDRILRDYPTAVARPDEAEVLLGAPYHKGSYGAQPFSAWVVKRPGQLWSPTLLSP